MSLSDICSQQHQHEQQKLRQILLWGLLGSVGVHAVALGLSQLNLWRAATDEVSPIELIVTEAIPEEPETLPQPEQPAELSTETNDPAPAAASAPPRPAAVVAPPTPAPTPAPPGEAATPARAEPETLAESDLEAPVPEEAAAVEEETAAAVQEAIAPESDTTPAAPQSDRLRDLLQRLRDTQNEAGTAVGETAPTASATAGAGTVPNAPAGESPGVAAAPSTTSGSGQGSRTVACQNCVRPSYPQSALEAGVEGRPMVSVDINPDGSVRSVTLIRSSGNPAIDQAAIQAARNSRFQPVAGGASVPIEYDLTIEGSRRNRDARRRGDRQAVELPPEPSPATATTAPSAAPPQPVDGAAPPQPVDSAEPPAAPETSAPESAGAEPPEPTPAGAESSAPATPASPPPAQPSPAPSAPTPSAPTPSAPPAPAAPTPAPPPAPAVPSSPSPPPAIDADPPDTSTGE